jgi:hypothetical protein
MALPRLSPTSVMDEPGREADVLWNQLVDAVEALQPVKKTADQSNSTTTLADVADLQRTVAAGTAYEAEWLLQFHSAAATTGFQFAVVPPANPTRFLFVVEYQTSATGWATFSQTLPTTFMGVTSSSYVANSAIQCRIRGIVVPSVAGTLKLQFRSEVANSAVVVRAGSTLRVA